MINISLKKSISYYYVQLFDKLFDKNIWSTFKMLIIFVKINILNIT